MHFSLLQWQRFFLGWMSLLSLGYLSIFESITVHLSIDARKTVIECFRRISFEITQWQFKSKEAKLLWKDRIRESIRQVLNRPLFDYYLQFLVVVISTQSQSNENYRTSVNILVSLSSKDTTSFIVMWCRKEFMVYSNHIGSR